MSSEEYKKIQGYDDLMQELNATKDLLANVDDKHDMLSRLVKANERIHILEKENLDMARILQMHVSSPGMLPCAIKREMP